MDIADKVLNIGIQRISDVKEMASLIKIADTKEDIQLIFDKMNERLESGMTEIEALEKSHRT